LNNELVIYIFNPCSSEHHVYTIKLMLIILNLLIMVMTSIVSVNLWVPVNPMGTGLGKILNLSWVWIFKIGLDIFFTDLGLGRQNPIDL